MPYRPLLLEAYKRTWKKEDSVLCLLALTLFLHWHRTLLFPDSSIYGRYSWTFHSQLAFVGLVGLQPVNHSDKFPSYVCIERFILIHIPTFCSHFSASVVALVFSWEHKDPPPNTSPSPVSGLCPAMLYELLKGCQSDHPTLPLNPSPAAVIHNLSPRPPKSTTQAILCSCSVLPWTPRC